MGSGFLFHVFAERDFPCLVDADGIRTNNSLHHSLHMLNYFMWETWMLGGMVLSPCYYKQCSNILFTCLCSLQGPLSWRCLHWWKAQKVRQARITHPQPTDQMANKHQERRKGFLHNAHLPGSNSAAQELLVSHGEPGWDTDALKLRHLSKTVPRSIMCSLKQTIYLFWTSLAISNPFASPSDTFAGINHPEREYSRQWHPCQQRHYSCPQ